jgi:branched-chain amino acid transport system substrate-binding protein
MSIPTKIIGRLVVVATVCVSAVTLAAGGVSATTKPSRAPITIGFLNEQQGAYAFPDFGAGAQAARVYLDSHGGVGGRPLRFLDCYTDGSPAASVACANRFVVAHVPVVIEGIDIGSDAAVPILAGAGIPLVGHTAFGPVQSNSRDAFFFGAATGAYDVVPLALINWNLHLKSVTYMAEDNPQDRGFVSADSVPAAQALGITYQPIFYNAATPNYQAIVASAIATGAQALFFTAPEPDCTSLVAAARTLSYQGAIFAGSCSAFIQADASSASGVFTSSDLFVPDDTSGVPATAATQVKTYMKEMKSYAPQYTQGFAQDTFSTTMDLSTILGQIHGGVTASSVFKALRRVHGLRSFMGQALVCNGHQWPGESSACASGLIVYRVSSGKRVMYSHGFVHAQNLVKG